MPKLKTLHLQPYMKKTGLSVFILFCCFASLAQESKTPEVSEKAVPAVREDQLMLDFNWNYLLNTPDSVKISGASWGFNAKLMYDVPIQKSNFSFALGGAISTANFYSNSEVKTFNQGTDSSFSAFVPIDESRNYKRNKYTVTYADIPAELRYRSKPDKRGFRWKVAVGAQIGYHLQTHSKIIEDSKKFKTYDFQNFEKWRYGASLRVGYGKVAITGFYSATSIFEENKGAFHNPISIGITLMPF